MNKSKKWIGVNTRNPLPLRAAPDAKSKQLAAIPDGAQVTVCDTKSGWLYVKYDGTYGYVSTAYVKSTATFGTISKTVKWNGSTTSTCRMRAWAHASADPVLSLKKGAALKIMDTLDGFYYCEHGGKRGFVPQTKVRYIGEKLTPAVFLAQVKAVQEYARTHGYIYADSQSTVPCADKKISCDRLISRALWDLGMTDQPKGGVAFRHDFDSWFRSHGFKKSTSMTAAKAGSICVVMNPSGSSRHMFVIASKKGGQYTRYDCGSNDWIKSKQPLAGLWMSKLIAIYNL